LAALHGGQRKPPLPVVTEQEGKILSPRAWNAPLSWVERSATIPS